MKIIVQVVAGLVKNHSVVGSWIEENIIV